MFKVRYGKAIVGCAVLAAFGLVLTLVLTHSGPAKPRPTPHPQEDSTTLVDNEGIKPGNYATAINIHNPSFVETVTLYKRAVLSYAESVPPTGITQTFVSYSLLPGYAVEVDCEDIGTLLGDALTFNEGYVTIFSTGALDVVGVYSSEPPVVTSSPSYIPGIALNMQNILPRFETVRPATTATSPLPPGRYLEYSAKFVCGNTQTVPP